MYQWDTHVYRRRTQGAQVRAYGVAAVRLGVSTHPCI
jgi:hypothetical protein